MQEHLYSVNSALIALILFASMLVALEVGYRIGLQRHGSVDEAAQGHINAVQASMLGILALLLGFTFSLSLQRFDSRSEAVVDEANAISTAYLRAQLLERPLQDDVQSLLRRYLAVRIEASAIPVFDNAARATPQAEATRLQGELWSRARQAADAAPSAVGTVLFIQAINDTIGSFEKRDAALNRHVPEVVLLLLYATFVMAGAIVGFACGTGGHRPSTVSYVMVGLMVVLVFIILDLDRPTRGLIEVSQQSLLDLRSAVGRDGGNAPR